jgi:hypothetical protein
MKRTSPEKHRKLSQRDQSIASEYYRLREKKGLRPLDALKAIEDIGFLSQSGRPLRVKTIRCIVTNKKYLKNDRSPLNKSET